MNYMREFDECKKRVINRFRGGYADIYRSKYTRPRGNLSLENTVGLDQRFGVKDKLR